MEDCDPVSLHPYIPKNNVVRYDGEVVYVQKDFFWGDGSLWVDILLDGKQYFASPLCVDEDARVTNGTIYAVLGEANEIIALEPLSTEDVDRINQIVRKVRESMGTEFNPDY